jgi:deferrochelatase/peroxidase EfeB
LAESKLELDDIQSGVLRPRPTPYAATYVLFRIDDRNAGGIIATVFKLAQAVDDQRHHLFVPDVSDYSTHISEQ